MKTVMAVYENGVFRPVGPVDLPEHSSVEVLLGQNANPGTPAKARTWDDLKKFAGKVKWPEDGVEYQRRIRDEEWP